MHVNFEWDNLGTLILTIDNQALNLYYAIKTGTKTKYNCI